MPSVTGRHQAVDCFVLQPTLKGTWNAEETLFSVDISASLALQGVFSSIPVCKFEVRAVVAGDADRKPAAAVGGTPEMHKNQMQLLVQAQQLSCC